MAMGRKQYGAEFREAQWPALVARLALQPAAPFRDVPLAPGETCHRTPAGLRFILTRTPGGALKLDNVCVC